MNVTLYKINNLSAHKPFTIRFESLTERTNYFNSIVNQSTPNYMGNDWDEYNLYNEITVNYINMTGSNDYNYVKLTEKTSQEHFYYVIGFEQIGVSSTKLKLKKDTFMTYMSVSGRGIYLGQRPSLVVREHKPRFNYTLNTILIDEFLENNNNTTPKIINEDVITGTVRMRLVYRNRSSDWKPVAYVYTESPQSVSYIGDDWVGNLEPGYIADSNSKFYVWSGNYQYTFGSGTPNVSVTDDWTTYYHILLRNAVGTWSVHRVVKSSGGSVPPTEVLTIPAGGGFKIKVGTTTVNQLYFVNAANLSWSTIQTNYQTINNQPSGSMNTPTFSAIDIYDANNERIVEIPYFDYTMTFRRDGQGLYVNLTQNFKREFSVNQLIKIGTGTTLFDTSKVDKNRVRYNEPKLYSSQFSPRFITMNGITQALKLEWVNKGYGITGPNLEIRPYFEGSVLMPSLFNLELRPNTGDMFIKSQIDEFIKRWTVNNEIAVVKDDAYTYNEYYRDLDDRSRKIAEDASLRNTAFNVVNQGLNVVGGAFQPKNAAQIGTRAVSAGINIAQSIAEHNDYMQQNMIKYNQKLISLQLSMSQISGSSLDFLRSFNGDKMRLHNFGLRDRDLLYWDDVFFKYGYQTLEYTIPVLKTRKYFDYKQFIMDEYEQDFGIDEESYEDLRLRCAEGITIFHLVDGNIDWGQTKENWEV